MTGGSAAALGLVERGLLREGYHADVTVFDPATIADRATYDDPHQYAAGISTVLVNGDPRHRRGRPHRRPARPRPPPRRLNVRLLETADGLSPAADEAIPPGAVPLVRTAAT